MNIYSLKLQGLNCMGCAKKAKAALESLDNTQVLDISPTHAHVQSEASLSQLQLALNELGYIAELNASSSAPKPITPRSHDTPDKQSSAHKVTNNQEHHLTFLISGMSCASCVSSVEKAMLSLPFVSQAQVNLAEKTAWLSLSDPDNKQQIEAIQNAISQAGYQAELVLSDEMMQTQQRKQSQQELKLNRRNALMGMALGIPLMLWGMLGGNMMIQSQTDQIIWGLIGLLCLLMLTTAGKHFFINAYQALHHRRATMDTLVALGTGAAWIYSTLVVLFPDAFPPQARHVYFEASAMIIGLISLGHYIETKAKAKTNKSLQSLLKLQPDFAFVVIDGQEIKMPLDQIELGMQIRVKAGDKMPIDGVIVEGSSYIDEAMLTGEPIAIYKQATDKVFAGTLNQDGNLLIEVTKVGSQTQLARIIKQVRQAQSSKPAIAKLADQISAVFVPVVMAIALIAGLVWYLFGPAPQINYVLIVMTTILIIACPCALGLATPLSITVGIGKAAELGILIKDADVLQTASKITTVVFDKTGTLTQGKPSVQNGYYYDQNAKDTINQLIYQIESQSQHPLAQAMTRYLFDNSLIKPETQIKLENITTHRGLGMQAQWQDQTIYIGSPRFLTQQGINLDTASQDLLQLQQHAHTPVAIAIDNQISALFAISDPIRKEALDTVQQLQNQGLKVVMLSGDQTHVAQAIAQSLGINQVIAEVLPEQKAQHILALQEQGECVAMVGDGINDAPALAQADVSVAMGSGSDVAIESASMTLLTSSPFALVNAIALSKATVKNIKQNLLGAFIYNSFGIPIAAGVLYPTLGFLLSPVVAGAAMALSSITVVSNANRLRLFKAYSASESDVTTK